MQATVIRLAPRDSVPRPRPPLMTPEERDRALHAELRRARVRIARLEAALARAVRGAQEPGERETRAGVARREAAHLRALEDAREQRARAEAAERLLTALAEDSPAWRLRRRQGTGARQREWPDPMPSRRVRRGNR